MKPSDLIRLALALSLVPAAACARDIRVGGNGGYRSVQAAVDALPDTGGTILIAPGTYREKLHVTRNGVHLRGLGARPQDVVLVYGDSAIVAGGTLRSATLTSSGDDFHLQHLTVQNDYARDPAAVPSQAVALAITGDRDVIDDVRLLGAQDTLYANKGPNGRMARQYFTRCYIEGHVDFVFGNAKAWFDRCELHGIAHLSVMFTAQSKLLADEDSGYVFDHCVLTADPAATGIALGRPWRDYATVVFLDTRIEAPVIPAGWREWTPGKTSRLSTAYYAEYRSTGPGASPATREPYAHQLTDAEAQTWSAAAFFKGDLEWLPRR